MKIEVPLDDNLRRNMLTSRLTALGEKVYSNTEIKAYANDFVQIYNMSGGYYHHSHGTISGTIIGLYEQHRREYTEQIAVNLQSIINALKEYFEQEKDDTLKQQYFLAYKSVISLNDLVSVELIRLDQVSRQYSSLHQKATDTLNEANKLSEEAKGILTEAKTLNIGVTQTLERAENLSREADSLKTDVVTILGIFAAVIIAFSGGLSMLGKR